MTDYDYTGEIPVTFSAYRCVCGVVVTGGGVCPQCKEGDSDGAA